MNKEHIRVFEGFAGYGGASFGLKRSGLDYEVVGMSEFDKFASCLLEQNFPGIKNWGDITQISCRPMICSRADSLVNHFLLLGCNWENKTNMVEAHYFTIFYVLCLLISLNISCLKM